MLAVCGPAPVTHLSDSESGACFAGPHSPWPPPLAPPAPPRLAWALVHEGDFFAWAGETAERFDCAAGNPPFIRYQTFKGITRARALDLCARHGADFSGLASSWAPFLVATATLLKPGEPHRRSVHTGGHAVAGEWRRRAFGARILPERGRRAAPSRCLGAPAQARRHAGRPASMRRGDHLSRVRAPQR
jgi:hypothetical protein